MSPYLLCCNLKDADYMFFDSAASAAADVTAPPCSDCTTIDGVPLASIASTDIIVLSYSGSSFSDVEIAARTAAPSTPTTIATAPRIAIVKRASGDGITPTYPLLYPDEDEGVNAQRNFVRRLKRSVGDNSDNNIAIVPSNRQLSSWFIRDRQNKRVPIGVTSEFFSFGSRPKTWKMVGMTGCTAVFIAVCIGYSSFDT